MANLNPYEILTVVLLFMVLPAAVFGTAVWKIVREALDLKHLVELGGEERIETEAIVIEKKEELGGIRRTVRKRYLRYEYRDGFGAVHRRRAEVPEEIWREAREGGPLLVVYSPRRPGVSAPRAVLDQAAARAALRRQATGSDDAARS